MSKFYNYLNEKDNIRDYPDDLELIKKDCLPFLKDLKRSKYPFLYSGRSSWDPFVKRKVRKNRRPKDSPIELHEIFDRFFKNNFGVKARSEGMFVSRSSYLAEDYGTPYWVFPIGNKYKFIWSDQVEDLYENFKYLADYLKRDFGVSVYNLQTSIKNLLEKLRHSKYIYYDTKYEQFHSSDEYVESPVTFDQDQFIGYLDKIVNEELGNKYKQTKKLSDISDVSNFNEIILITDSVWLVNYDYFEKLDMMVWIDKNV